MTRAPFPHAIISVGMANEVAAGLHGVLNRSQVSA